MVCRLCFAQSGDYIEIFSEEKISKYIKKFLELEITKHDPLSKLICNKCWEQLTVFQRFYMQIKEAQKRPLMKLKKEQEVVQMDGSSFEYVNTEIEEDNHDINEAIETVTQNEELAEQIVPDNNDNTITTDPPSTFALKKVRNYKKLTKTTRSFKNEEERKFFVGLMKKEECIWNRTHNLHCSSRALIEAWKRIAVAMVPPKTVHECKVMWKSLRDALRYERRKAAGGFDQGSDLRNLLHFVSSANGQKKNKNLMDSIQNTPESTSKLSPAKCKAEMRKKYKIQNYHMFDSTNPAWSERTCEGSASDNMSAYSEGHSKHFSNNVSFETVTTKPHSTVGVFTIASAPSTTYMETMNEPPPVQYKSNSHYGYVKNEFKEEVSDLVESISKALNRLVTIATTQVHTKSQTIEFKYEYIWKLIECLYAQMEQTTINDLNQRIINMVYEGCKIDEYPESYHSESESVESKKNSIPRKRKQSDDYDGVKTNLKKSKIEHSGLVDLILKVHEENKSLFSRVTNEILSIKADVRKIKADLTFKQNDTVLNCDRFPFTRMFPFKDKESFLIFESDCSENNELLKTLQIYYKNEDSSNSKAFLRNNLKKIITDDVAVMFSWQGTEQKTQMKNFTVFEALRIAFREVFPKSSDLFANTVLKRHFQYAMDRIKKRKPNVY